MYMYVTFDIQLGSIPGSASHMSFTKPINVSYGTKTAHHAHLVTAIVASDSPHRTSVKIQIKDTYMVQKQRETKTNIHQTDLQKSLC